MADTSAEMHKEIYAIADLRGKRRGNMGREALRQKCAVIYIKPRTKGAGGGVNSAVLVFTLCSPLCSPLKALKTLGFLKG